MWAVSVYNKLTRSMELGTAGETVPNHLICGDRVDSADAICEDGDVALA